MHYRASAFIKLANQKQDSTLADQAIECWIQSTLEEPGYLKSWKNLFRVYTGKRQYQEASLLANRIPEEDITESSFENYFSLQGYCNNQIQYWNGRHEALAGNYGTAIIHYSLSPQWPSKRLEKAIMLGRLGNPEKMFEIFDEIFL